LIKFLFVIPFLEINGNKYGNQKEQDSIKKGSTNEVCKHTIRFPTVVMLVVKNINLVLSLNIGM